MLLLISTTFPYLCDCRLGDAALSGRRGGADAAGPISRLPSRCAGRLCSLMGDLLPNLMKDGGEHELAAAVFPLGGDADVSSCDARLRPSGGAPGCASQQWHGKCRIDPGFIGHLGALVQLEPPWSGPGPVVSKLRRPDGSIIQSVVGDYTNPILGPEAAATIKKIGEMELSGTVLPNPHNQCWPEPTPFTMSIQQGMQLIQQKDQVILLYLSDHNVRHVRLNVPHSANPVPSWQGESVGRYEGDTLVIDTIGQKVGPLSMIDRFGTPFSPALHVIERYRLTDGGTARDTQLQHESADFGAAKSTPPTNPHAKR